MKKILIILILLLPCLTPLQASNNPRLETQVLAQVEDTYTFEIESFLDFGSISKSDKIQSKDLTLSLKDTLPHSQGRLQVLLSDEDLKMWDQEKEHSISLKASQKQFDFDMKDQSQSLSLSFNPQYLTAAGSYKALLNFEINYLARQDESLNESPHDWFVYECSSSRKTCKVKGFSENILALLDEKAIKEPISVRIPQAFEGKAITEIERNAFRNDENQALVLIESLYLSDSIKVVGAGSFYNQPLIELKGGWNLETIDLNAFNSCQLKHLRLKDKVKIINSGAFHKNPLEIIELPLSIQRIYNLAFDHNRDLSRDIIIRYYGPGYENNQKDPLIATHKFEGYKLENNEFEKR